MSEPSKAAADYARETEYHCQKCKDFAEQVTIPGTLAQRILAALETPSVFGSDHRVDLARELRARCRERHRS